MFLLPWFFSWSILGSSSLFALFIHTKSNKWGPEKSLRLQESEWIPKIIYSETETISLCFKHVHVLLSSWRRRRGNSLALKFQQEVNQQEVQELLYICSSFILEFLSTFPLLLSRCFIWTQTFHLLITLLHHALCLSFSYCVSRLKQYRTWHENWEWFLEMKESDGGDPST